MQFKRVFIIIKTIPFGPFSLSLYKLKPAEYSSAVHLSAELQVQSGLFLIGHWQDGVEKANDLFLSQRQGMKLRVLSVVVESFRQIARRNLTKTDKEIRLFIILSPVCQLSQVGVVLGVYHCLLHLIMLNQIMSTELLHTAKHVPSLVFPVQILVHLEPFPLL